MLGMVSHDSHIVRFGEGRRVLGSTREGREERDVHRGTCPWDSHLLRVLPGKFNLGSLYERIGFAKEIISRGKFAQLDADNRPFT